MHPLLVIRREVTRAGQQAHEQSDQNGASDSDAMMGRSVALREDHSGADGGGLWPEPPKPRWTATSASSRKPEGCQSSHVCSAQEASGLRPCSLHLPLIGAVLVPLVYYVITAFIALPTYALPSNHDHLWH